MTPVHPNVAKILASYQGVTSEDPYALTGLISPDVVLHVPGHSPSGGSWSGPDALTAPLSGLAEHKRNYPGRAHPCRGR